MVVLTEFPLSKCEQRRERIHLRRKNRKTEASTPSVFLHERRRFGCRRQYVTGFIAACLTATVTLIWSSRHVYVMKCKWDHFVFQLSLKVIEGRILSSPEWLCVCFKVGIMPNRDVGDTVRFECFFLFFFFTHTHTHTHTHTLTHANTLTHTHTHARTHTHSPTHTHSHTHTRTLWLPTDKWLKMMKN